MNNYVFILLCFPHCLFISVNKPPMFSSKHFTSQKPCSISNNISLSWFYHLHGYFQIVCVILNMHQNIQHLNEWTQWCEINWYIYAAFRMNTPLTFVQKSWKSMCALSTEYDRDWEMSLSKIHIFVLTVVFWFTPNSKDIFS